MKLFCCGCDKEIEARLTNGVEVYSHRKDLSDLPFWKCDNCKNFVGCHHKTSNPTKPLGNIPTPELREMRSIIHRVLDPLWKSGKIARGALYSRISQELGYTYHSAEIRSVSEAQRVYKILDKLKKELMLPGKYKIKNPSISK